MDYKVNICPGIVAIDLSKIGDMPIYYIVDRMVEEYMRDHDNPPVIKMNAYTADKLISSLPIQWYNIKEITIPPEGYQGIYHGYQFNADETVPNDIIYLEGGN